MKRQSKMFGKVYLHFRYGSWHDQWRRNVASSIKYGSEVLTRPVFDGAMFGVCVWLFAYVVVVIRRKEDPEA